VSSISPDGWYEEAPFTALYDLESYPGDEVAADSGPFIATSDTTITSANVFEEFITSGFDLIAAGAWSADGLWRVTKYRSSTSGWCFGYNQGGSGRAGEVGSSAPSYDTGAATSGTLTSPVISGIVSASSVALKLRHFADMEPGMTKDLASIEIRESGGGPVIKSFDKSDLGLSATGSTGGFAVLDLDITAEIVGAGDFEISFVFDSVDSSDNSGEGWYVDDIEVAVTP